MRNDRKVVGEHEKLGVDSTPAAVQDRKAVLLWAAAQCAAGALFSVAYMWLVISIGMLDQDANWPYGIVFALIFSVCYIGFLASPVLGIAASIGCIYYLVSAFKLSKKV